MCAWYNVTMYNNNSSKSQKGFTLVEIVVVISIIVVLLSVILASISQARMNSRDKQRIADLSSIHFALIVYREKNNKFPTGSDNVIGTGTSFDVAIAPYLANIPKDPLSSGSYKYRYNSDFTCTEPHQRVLYAQSLENTNNANFSAICTNDDAGEDATDESTATEDSYIMILK